MDDIYSIYDKFIKKGAKNAAGEIGYFQTIRSSYSEEGMIGWNEPEFDKDCSRWFEAIGGGFDDWEIYRALEDIDVLDTIDFRELHPKTKVRNSHLEFIWAKDGTGAAFAEIFLSVYRGEQSDSFKLIIEDLTALELAEVKQAIQDWHCTGRISFGRVCCIPCWD